MEGLADKIFQKGHIAVVTGASSGIGRATAEFCISQHKMVVYMVDVDEDELHVAANALGECAIPVVADVADFEAMEALSKRVLHSHGAPHFLMNNAGVHGAGGGSALGTSTQDMRRTIDVNTFGPIHGCSAFVPHMLAASTEKEAERLVVNTGSKQGITMPPGNLAYNVSKSALKSYTEGLEHELRTSRQTDGKKVFAALLVPGWVNTSIVRKELRANGSDEKEAFFHEGKPAAGAWMPSQVVDFLVEELNRGKFYIICPDNEVDRLTDNARMTWTMQDVTEDRPPLSRWHTDYKDQFTAFLMEQTKHAK